jgi:hypothetical protein
MRYLRHAPLAFWLATVLGFVAVGAYAWQAGSTQTIVKVDRLGTPAASRVHAMELMTRVSGAYPSITAGTMTQWATDTADLARRGLSAAESGQPPNDQLVAAWTAAVAAAEQLAATSVNDRALVIERVAQLGIVAREVVMIANAMRTDLSIAPQSTPTTNP